MKKLEEFMKLNGITYRQLAITLNTSTSTVYDILKNGRMPSLLLAYEIEKLTFKKITLYDWLDSTESVHDETADNKKKKKKNVEDHI